VITRRRLLRNSLGAGFVAALGSSSACSHAPAPGSELLGIVPFVDEPEVPFGVAQRMGLDGRMAFDIATLTPQTLIIGNDQFFIRTRNPDLLDSQAPWKITVHGLVKAPIDLTFNDLQPLVESQGTHLMECSGNDRGVRFGLISAANWAGISIAKLLQKVEPLADATRVLISGFDQYSLPSANSVPGASWVFTREQLESSGAFLASEMNDQPLPKDHGYPIRLVVPGWYGCACIKWVNEIKLVDEAEPSTSQMREFAFKTHQDGVPELARDFQPARIEQAAVPVRVEKWRNDGLPQIRVVGIMWGGSQPTDKLAIRFSSKMSYEPVESLDHKTNSTWTLWSHNWRPKLPGRYQIQLKISDPTIHARRLDTGFYHRTVVIDKV